MLEREFVLSEAVALNPQPLPPSGPGPVPWRSGPVPQRWHIAVTIPDTVQRPPKSSRGGGGQMGSAACCSGFDIAFRREIATMALDSD
jgi:hypothetical protein